MYVSIFEMQPREGHLQEFLRAFVELGVAELAIEIAGCQRVVVLEPAHDGGPVVIIGEWPSRELYDAWGANPRRIALGPGLAPYTAGDPGELRPVGLYSISHEAAAE